VTRSTDQHTDAADAPLTNRVRELATVSYPLMVASLSTLALAVADTAIVGRYSTEALATVALALPVYVLASALVVPWGTAVQILVARWAGADDHARIGRMFDVGLVVCLAIGAGVTLALLVLAGPLVTFMADGEPPPDAATVLRILACGLPFLAVTTHYRGVFGGLKHTGIAMRVGLLVAVTNIPLDYLLVFGADLGAVGSALATLIATLLGAVCMTGFGLRRFRPVYGYPRRAHLRGGGELIRPLWRIGWPDASFAGIAYGADVLLVGIVASLGATVLAGHRTLTVTIVLLWTVVFSCSSGVSILAGQRLGADDLDGVAAYRRAGTVLTFVIATPLVLPAVLAPAWYFGLFSPDPAVVAEARAAAPLLLGILAGMILAMPMTGVLRAGGDTRGVMVIGTLAQLGTAVPVAYVATVVFDLGLPGVLLGLVGSWVTRTALTAVRHRQGRWREDAAFR
jgi:MATE family multidrug resistance protein